jgi:hypothetical protein
MHKSEEEFFDLMDEVEEKMQKNFDNYQVKEMEEYI